MQYVFTPYSTPVEPFAWIQTDFTEEELNWLSSKALEQNSSALVGGGANGVVNPEIRRSKVKWVENTPETEWVYKRLSHYVGVLNSQFYRLDLTGFGEALQFTTYEENEQGMYGWHQDYGSGISRKLSVVLQLTDPSRYEGGNLEVLTSGNPIVVRKQRGLLAVFPSYTLHQVTPVTRGIRQTLVTWVTGPAFR